MNHELMMLVLASGLAGSFYAIRGEELTRLIGSERGGTVAEALGQMPVTGSPVAALAEMYGGKGLGTGDRALAEAKSDKPSVRARTADESAGHDVRYLRVGSVGLVPVMGVLGRTPREVTNAWGDRIGTTYAEIVGGVEAAAADPEVRGVMLVSHSPGGNALPAESAALSIRSAMDAAHKPLWAMHGDMAASAALYLTSQADHVVVSPGSWSGSIGTIMTMMDFSGMLAEWGIKVNAIKNPDHKDVGAPYRPMSDADRARLQAQVDAYAGQFRAAVARGRRVDSKKVDAWVETNAFVGAEAVKAGLADGVVQSLRAAVMQFERAMP